MNTLKVIGWTSYDSSCQNYLISSRHDNDELVKVIVEEIRKNKYFFSGSTHQDNTVLGVPVLSNGKCVRCSERAWGAFIAIAYDNEPNYEPYVKKEYLTKEEVLPFNKVDENMFIIEDNKEAIEAPEIMVRLDTEEMKTSIMDGMDFKSKDKALLKSYPILKDKIANQFD